MKTLLLLLSMIVFVSCNNLEKTTEVAAAKISTESTSAAQKIAHPNSSAKKVSLDSIGPKKNARMVVSTSRPKARIEQTFPHDISLKTVDGQVLNSKNLLKPKDKPTVLLFWLTTCYPCALEMQAIQKEFPAWKEKADFDLYAISTDFDKNYGKFVKRVEEKKWPWPAYHDLNREFRQVMPGGLNGLPQTFVLDKKGNIVYHKRKYQPGDEHVLFQKIREAAAM